MVDALTAIGKLKKLDFEHWFSLYWHEESKTWLLGVHKRIDNDCVYSASGTTPELAAEALLVKVM